MSKKIFFYVLMGIALVVVSACEEQGSADKGKAPVPAVVVAPVIAKPVASATDFVGQTEAFQSVDLRARVTGFLLKRSFKEGYTVKQGDVLFVVDPSEYIAAREAAVAKVEGGKATILEAASQLKRYEKLEKSGTYSPAQLDSARAKEGLARANLSAYQADLKLAELNVEYTQIVSPIDGRIGASKADVGNLIGPDSGVLATVVALNPIRVNFMVSERLYLNYMQERKKDASFGFTPKILLANNQTYPHDGKLDFVDNTVDPSTGTIRVRVEFPNPDRLILPGQFVNLTLVSEEPEDQLVVPQAAIQENQTGPFVLVVDKDSKVELRPIKTGQRDGTEITVTDGLTAGESIIVQGIQKVRPGAEVNPVSEQTSEAAK